jgi:hypothetical protein
LPFLSVDSKLFADDTKLYAVVNEAEQQISLQNDIDSLLKWSDRWLLKFNKRHAPFSECHAPFDKKNVAPCIADVPFFISSNDL